MIDVLTEICNRIWRTGEWPTPSTQSLIITLPKKGNLQLCQNYRTISLISHSSKVMLKVILNRLNVGLKTLLLQGLSEPEFYGDLVYKFRKIIGKIDFPYHFKKIIVRYKKIGYNINVMRQTACLVVNPIKVNSFAYLFNCTTVGRTSD